MATLIPHGCFSDGTETTKQIAENSHPGVDTTIKYNAFTFKGVKN